MPRRLKDVAPLKPRVVRIPRGIGKQKRTYRLCQHPKPTERYADGGCKLCRKDRYERDKRLSSDPAYLELVERIRNQPPREPTSDGLIGLPKHHKSR
jgi:hypothetical protein